MPRDDRFRALFDRHASNIAVAARLLESLARSESLDERCLMAFELNLDEVIDAIDGVGRR